MGEPNEHSYPLTLMQQGMLFHALSSPHAGVDIEQLIIELPEIVDAARLHSAWKRVVARHEILRSAFHWDGAEPMQSVVEKTDIAFEREEIPALADAVGA